MAPQRSARGERGRTTSTSSEELSDAASGVGGEIGTSPTFDKQCDRDEQQYHGAEEFPSHADLAYHVPVFRYDPASAGHFVRPFD